jgi:SAM-dependent methyltransferase
METVACVLCGGTVSDIVLTTRDRLYGARADESGPTEFTLVRCRSCRLVYLDPRPTADEIGAYYPDDYNVPRGRGGSLERLEEGYRRRQQREVVHWLSQLRPQRGRLLDVGCGGGELLVALRDDGWTASGIEPGPRSAALARERLGLDVQTAAFDAAVLEPGSFDVVVFSSVLEHLPDPVAALRRGRELLAPGGLLAVLFLPLLDSPQARLFGARWQGLDAPRHLYHFERATFARALDTVGLKVVATRAYSRRHNASIWTASTFPGLQKQRLHVVQRSRPGTAATRKAAFLGATTLYRPLARLEALAGLQPQSSYFVMDMSNGDEPPR